MIRGNAALVVLTDSGFEVPPVPPGENGVGWLRGAVARFSSGATHRRRRALTGELIAGIPAGTLEGRAPVGEAGGDGVAGTSRAVSVVEEEHPVARLARALGVSAPVVDLVRDVAQAYQPGTGDERRADRAVDRLVRILGGERDEATAARIGILVQACDATAALIERSRQRAPADVLRDDPPVRATRRRAIADITVDGVRIEAGEIVLVELGGELAFGAGPHRCPGRALALAAVSC